MKDRVCIYGLYDERAPHLIRYVGKAQQVAQRLRGHVQASKKGRLPVHAWIRSLLRAGQRPQARVLCTCSAQYWEETETRFIRLYCENGHPLLNVSGGGGPSYIAKRAAMATRLALLKRVKLTPTKPARHGTT